MPTPDHIRNRFLDELVSAASVLDNLDSAAVAEAWASGAVAEWRALGGADRALADEVVEASPLAASLIEWIDGGDTPASLVAAVDGPEWLPDVGRHELTRAVQLKHAGSTDAGIILEYTAPSGDRHDLSVSIDGGYIVGIAVGPEGLAIAAVEEEREGVSIDELELSQAADLVREALSKPLVELSAAAEATVPLVVRRMGLSMEELAKLAESSIDRTLPERFAEDDQYAAELIASALRTLLAAELPEAVSAAFERFSDKVANGDPDALTVFDIAGLNADEPLDLDRFVALVGSYLAPVSLSPHTDPQFEALIELEPADWIGVILGMSRAKPGTNIDGDALVSFINKAPEITTTIPKADAPRLAWAFEQMLYSWEVTGVLTDDGVVSEAAAWLLPHAALAVWG